MREEPPGPENADHFFDRFVHPWLAGATTVGFGLWVIAFCIALVGIVGRELPGGQSQAVTFFYSGFVGTLGMLVLAGCTVVFLLLRCRRVLANR